MKVLLIFILAFTGCMESKKEISCSQKPVEDLVKEIIQDDLAREITCLKQVEQNIKNNKDADSFISSELMSNMAVNMCIVMFDTILKNNSNDMIAIYEDNKKKINSNSFNLTGIRTTDKNEELSQVECKATVGVNLSDFENYSKELVYTAQLSDNGKEIYVEISSDE